MTTYTNRNFKTKKALKEAVADWNEYQKAKDWVLPLTVGAVGLSKLYIPNPVTLWNPGLGQPNPDGKNYVSGPWYPLPHKWYAEVWCEKGVVVKVK